MDEQKPYDGYHNYFREKAYKLLISGDIGRLCRNKGITKTLTCFTGKTTVKEMRDKICETLGKGFEEGGTILKNPDQDLQVSFGLMPDLIDIIPAPNEDFLNKTLEDCLDKYLKESNATRSAPLGSFLLRIKINSPTPEPIQKLNTILDSLKEQLEKDIPEYNGVRSGSTGSDIPPLRALEDLIEKIQLHYTETPEDTSNTHGIKYLNLSPETAVLQTRCLPFSRDVLQTDKGYKTHLYSDASKQIIQSAIKYILEIDSKQCDKYVIESLKSKSARPENNNDGKNDCTMM